METRTFEQLPKTSIAQGTDLLPIQTPGGLVMAIELSRLFGRLGPVDVVYQTRALLYADLAWAAGKLAIVWGDADPAKLGYYVKTGGIGAGAWNHSNVFAGEDATNPAFTFELETVSAVTPGSLELSGAYPAIHIKFKLPVGAGGAWGGITGAIGGQADLIALLNAKAASALIGAANGIAPTDATNKLPIAYLPAGVVGGMSYQATWNAATNTPAIPAAAAGNNGWYYRVATAGATAIDGISDWKVSDWIVSNGVIWEKIDNTDQVTSVAGRQGVVVLDKTDVGLAAVDDTADVDKPVSTATANALNLKKDKAPAIQNVASAAVVTPTFTNDQVNITAQAVPLTLANPTGAAVDGWGMAIRIKDDGVARAIAYGANYRGFGLVLPASTTAGKELYLGMVWNAAAGKWDVLVAQQET